MPTAVLTPFSRTAARSTGANRWRKRLLPVGNVEYDGQLLQFTPEYLQRLTDAFRAQAYDYVPFQLAGDKNLHTNDVERYGGRVEDMGVDLNGEDGPGLYVTLGTTDRGSAVLSENPDLGVSARIVLDYPRSDGKYFPGAIQHVLGTHDPRIPGLGGWRAVEAANDVQVTIDLSGAKFAGEAERTGGMPELTPEQQAKMAKLLNLPDDQFDQLVAGLTAPPMSDEDLAALLGETTEPGDGNLSDDELNELLIAAAELDAQGQFAPPQPAGAGAQPSAALSNDHMLALELTNARADYTEQRLNDVTRHLDSERFKAEQRRYLDMGIPARIVADARPLLLGAGHVVDLANGEGAVDAGAIIRKVLNGVAELHKAMGLEVGVELGSPMDEPEQHNQAATARAEIVGRARQQMGLVR